jgi:hypothetical protein
MSLKVIPHEKFCIRINLLVVRNGGVVTKSGEEVFKAESVEFFGDRYGICDEIRIGARKGFYAACEGKTTEQKENQTKRFRK